MVAAEHNTSANAHSNHSHHENRPELQHHFETPEQQFDASKFGMWLFLATELLLFGGLFCAYVIYRVNHPDIFHYAHKFLDPNLGALNTAVLLFSSLTMAWAVRASQLNKRVMMIVLLSITVLCGITFMGVKYVEYSSKIKYGLTWGTEFNYEGMQEYLDSHHKGEHGEHKGELSHLEVAGPADPYEEEVSVVDQTNQTVEDDAFPEDADPSEIATLETNEAPGGDPIEYTQLPQSAVGPTGLHKIDAPVDQDEVPGSELDAVPANVHVFFGIYYCMTGLHAVHVIVGLIAIIWLIVKGARGHFSHNYYTPVDLVGLYWHVVDLIWIYLFPLLYLIE